MKKFICIIAVLAVVLSLTACSTDTYSESSKSSNFLLKNVVSVKLSGPGTEIGGDDTEVTLDSESGQQFNDFITLVKGKSLIPSPKATFSVWRS